MNQFAIIAATALAAGCDGASQTGEVDLHLNELMRFESGAADRLGPGATPTMMLPVYPMLGPDSTLWVVDNGQQRLVKLSLTPEVSPTFIGSGGSKPGEFSAPVGMDASPSGDLWIADLGNARVTRVSGGAVLDHINTDEPPLAVVAGDSALWVLVVSSTAVFAVYNYNGHLISRTGAPAFSERWFARYNQGVTSRGDPPRSQCAAVVALSFLPRVSCYDESGELQWEFTTPGERVEDWQESIRSGSRRTDLFAYIDVTQTDRHVIGLYSGESPSRDDGVSGRVLHLIDSSSGTLVQTVQLSQPTKYLDTNGDLLVTITYKPHPTARIFEVPPGWRHM